MRTILPPSLLVGLSLCIVFLSGPAYGTEVPVAFEYKANANCVTSFEVKPEAAVINSWLHKISPREVVWSPVPASSSQELEGVSWKIEKDKKSPNEPASLNATCTGRIKQNGNKQTCIPELNWSSLSGHWDYKVTATKQYCPPVTVDPAIIFRGGGGTAFLPPFNAFLLAVAIAALLLIVWRIARSRRAAKS